MRAKRNNSLSVTAPSYGSLALAQRWLHHNKRILEHVCIDSGCASEKAYTVPPVLNPSLQYSKGPRKV